MRLYKLTDADAKTAAAPSGVGASLIWARARESFATGLDRRLRRSAPRRAVQPE